MDLIHIKYPIYLLLRLKMIYECFILGKVKLSQLARLQDGICSTSMLACDQVSGAYVGHLNQMLHDRRVFVVCCRFDFYKALMDVRNYNRPLTFEMALQHIGNTSVQYITKTILSEVILHSSGLGNYNNIYFKSNIQCT